MLIESIYAVLRENRGIFKAFNGGESVGNENGGRSGLLSRYCRDWLIRSNGTDHGYSNLCSGSRAGISNF
jgi:hypothetical protein